MSIKVFKKQVVSNLSIDAALQPLAPVIAGYSISGSDDTALDTAGGQTILVNGSGFKPGATITMNNTSISVVTFISVDQLSFTSPAMSAGTYNLFAVNSDGGAAILAPGIVYSTFPTWTTAQGPLGSYYETQSISETVEANGDAPITYTLVAGDLPSGASLASDGTITGTSPIDSSSTTYSFTIRADDAESQSSTREFSLTINTDVVTWVTPTSGATINLDGSAYSQALSATDAAGYAVSYTANELPTGLTLDSGTISGTSTVEGTTTTLLTATAATTNRNATNTITWVVTLGDVYWKNVSLLLSGSTPTTTFINDASLNNSQLTIVGDTKPNNFNPYEEGYYSSYYGASHNNYLSIPSSSAYALSTNNFTIESWVYLQGASGASGQGGVIVGKWTQSGSAGIDWMLAVINPSTLRFYMNIGDTNINFSASSTLSYNVWTHVAVVRNGSTFTLYINGVDSGTATNAGSISNTDTTAIRTGIWNNVGSYINGYLSNTRVVNGTALYTSNFTPSTTPLTAVTNTVLLLNNSNRIVDTSVINGTITNANITVAAAHPFATPTTSAYNTQYSTYFDGTGDKLSIATNSAFTFGTGDFTIECWFNTSSATVSIFDLRNTIVQATPYLYAVSSTLRYYVSGGDRITSSTLSLNTWYHLALVRVSGVTKMYLNGQPTGSSYTDTNNYISNAVNIGGAYAAAQQHTGLISNLRVVKGVGVYTGLFTPSTSPLSATQSSGTNISAITGTSTSLLTCQDSTLKDNSTNNFTITSAGNAQPIALSPFTMTTSNTPVTSLGSAYFDGTGDYLALTGVNLSSGNFTIECWVYFTSFAAKDPHIFNFGTDGVNRYNVWRNGTSGKISFTTVNSSTYDVKDGTTSPVINTWYHVAVVSNNGTRTMYINGVAEVTSTTAINAGTNWALGYMQFTGATSEYLTGHISDFRVIKGTALYTSNFLPPQTPLSPVTNTQLLTCQTNGGATNNSFVDQSSFNNIITRAGNATQGTFSPFSQTGWSNYFDGTGDYLSLASSLSLPGDFTVEAWIYPTAFGSYNQIINSGSSNFQFLLTSSGVLNLWNVLSHQTSVSLNRWTHIAIARSGTNVNLYVDGVKSTNTLTSSTTYTPLYIGTYTGSSEFFTGHISNLRIVKDTALYTTTFTPSTTPLPAVANTELLTCQSNRLIDNSPNNFAITKAGDVSVQAYSPFGGVTSVPTSYSNYFDGTGDYLTTTTGSTFALSGDFTIELWVYPTVAVGAYRALITTGGAGSSDQLLIGSDSSINGILLAGVSSGNNVLPATGTWSHIAVSRTGTSVYFFLNGVQQGTPKTSSATALSSSTTLSIGYRAAAGDGAFTGYISNLRVIKGTGLYTSAFTPSTAPLTTTSQGATASQVSLLTCQSATMIDNSASNFTLTAAGDVKPRPFNPFGTTTTTNVSYTPSVNGGSMYFDGTGDYLSTTLAAMGTSDITVEAWVYSTSWSASPVLIDFRPTNTNGVYLMLYFNTSGAPIYYVNSGAAITGSIVLATNTWNHVALCKTGGASKLYVNGVFAGTVVDNTNYSVVTTNRPFIGASGYSAAGYFSGYISNLRILTGTALYTSNFYPGSAPATPINNTTLLVDGTSGGIIDYHSSNDFETVGNTQLISEDPYGGSYYSNYFDGTGDYLDVGTPMSLSGDFTIEMWFKPDAVSKTYADLFTSASANFELGLNVNSLKFYDSGSAVITHQTLVTAGEWHHVALTRSGTTVYLYLDGVRSSSSATKSTTYVPYRIATYSSETFPGFISNLRVVSGSVLYSSATITVPTTALTAISGTQLLTCQSNSFKDNSTNNFTITRNGDVKVKSQNPFQQNTGKSLYFDGTGDYLQFPETPGAWYLGTNDFTIEGWVYPTARVSNGAYILARSQYGVNSDWLFNITSTGTLQFYMLSGGSSIVTSTGTVPLNQWTYIAVVRTTTTVKLYINGTNDGTLNGFSSALTISYGPTVVGNSSNNSGSTYFPGYIKDLRITKGVARTITVPTSPLKDK